MWAVCCVPPESEGAGRVPPESIRGHGRHEEKNRAEVTLPGTRQENACLVLAFHIDVYPRTETVPSTTRSDDKRTYRRKRD